MSFAVRPRAVSPAASAVASRSVRGLNTPAPTHAICHRFQISRHLSRQMSRRAASEEVIDVTPEPVPENDDAEASQPAESKGGLNLACPICHTTEFPLSGADLSCSRCSRTFNSNAEFMDLTLTSGVEYKSYKVNNNAAHFYL